MASALVEVSSFYEIRHYTEHFIQDEIVTVLELISKHFQKDSVFEYLFLGPMSFSLINRF